MKPEKERIQTIKQKIGKSKKTPSKGWRRSGGLSLLPIIDRKKFLISRIQSVIESMIEVHSGQQDLAFIAYELTVECAVMLVEERYLKNIDEFAAHENKIHQLSLNAADDIAHGDKTGKHIQRFIAELIKFHKRRDLYSKIVKVLGVKEISLEMIKRIQDAAHQCHIYTRTFLNSPTESDVEAALRWLIDGYEKGNAEFKKRFKKLDKITKDRLAEVDFPNNLDIMTADNVEPERVLRLIDIVADSIHKDRTKRKPRASPRKQLIFDLCDIYFQITGQKPIVKLDFRTEEDPGKFYDFAKLILKKVDPKLISKKVPPKSKRIKPIKQESLAVRIAEVCNQYNKRNS